MKQKDKEDLFFLQKGINKCDQIEILNKTLHLNLPNCHHIKQTKAPTINSKAT